MPLPLIDFSDTLCYTLDFLLFLPYHLLPALHSCWICYTDFDYHTCPFHVHHTTTGLTVHLDTLISLYLLTVCVLGFSSSATYCDYLQDLTSIPLCHTCAPAHHNCAACIGSPARAPGIYLPPCLPLSFTTSAIRGPTLPPRVTAFYMPLRYIHTHIPLTCTSLFRFWVLLTRSLAFRDARYTARCTP